jgi:hypothetical protein
MYLYSRDIQCTGRGLISTVRACPEFYMDCKLYCQDDKENCFLFNGNMLDGTPCGETGRCQSGQCTGMDQCNSKFCNIKLEKSLAGIREISPWQFQSQ